uniref:hypothetical protein n=1 Tax=Klebsiella pneumoniae TaxID=573 RepID=UPI003C7402EA
SLDSHSNHNKAMLTTLHHYQSQKQALLTKMCLSSQKKTTTKAACLQVAKDKKMDNETVERCTTTLLEEAQNAEYDELIIESVLNE